MDISAFIPDVREIIPGCPAALALRHLKRATVDLCRKSFVWTNVLTAAQVTPDSFPFTVVSEVLVGYDEEISWDQPLVGGERVVKIVAVNVDGTLMDLTNDVDITGAWRNETGTPQRYLEDPKGVITLIPRPWADVQMIVDVVLEPGDESNELKDSIAIEHRETIVSGALYRLFMVVNMPWTSADMAAFHKNIFDTGVRSALTTFQKHRRQGSMSTIPFTL